MSGSDLSPNQRRTLKARETLAATFPDPEAKSQHYRDLAERSAERRRGGVVLSADETAVLVSCYELLSSIARRARQDKAATDEQVRV